MTSPLGNACQSGQQPALHSFVGDTHLTADPYIVELAGVFADLTDEEKEEILSGARWKAERKEGHQTGSRETVA